MLILLLAAVAIPFAASTCVDAGTDCQFATGNWSECDPCKKIRSRSLLITRPRHGQGRFCPTEPSEFEECESTDPCPEANCDAGTFTCRSTGRCIRAGLVCNGEDDCGDFTDEVNCTDAQLSGYKSFVEKCVSLPVLPFINLPGSGFNILTGEYHGNILDNNYYDGQCRQLYDPDADKTYRMPANFDAVHFQVKADGKITAKSHDSFHSYKSDQKSSQDDSFHAGVSAHFWFISASIETKWSQSKTHQSIFNSMQKSASSLYEVSSRVELAQFQMKSKGLHVTSNFRQAVYDLPIFYNAKVYTDFLNQFGTHYIYAGTMGGKFHNYYVVDKTTTKSNKLDEDSMKSCLSVEASVSFLSYVTASTGYSHCKAQSSTIATTDNASSLARDTITDNQGGTSDAAYLFVSSKTDPDRFKNWVTSIKQNPTSLTRKMKIICDLIPETKVLFSKTRMQNCQRSLKDYLSHHSPSTCNNCMNGGMPVNINQTCYCACPDGSIGGMCQLLDGQRLNIPTKNPYPFMVRKTGAEGGISALRVKLNNIYALRPSAINVYANIPYQGFNIERVIDFSTFGVSPGIGFDVDSDGSIWTFDTKNKSLVKVSSEGQLLATIPSGYVSNYKWSPTDLATTCDDELIIADLENEGRFFVLSHNGSAINVEQYNDQGLLGEAPKRITVAPDGNLFFTGETNITVYSKRTPSSPYQFNTTFPHLTQFPNQAFIDQTGTLFLSHSGSHEGASFLAVFRMEEDPKTGQSSYKPWKYITTNLWEGGCSGLAGQGSELYTSCFSPGLTTFRTI